MQRILIIEENKKLANLIAKKIKATFDFEIDFAYKFSEAKLYLSKYNYFVTLLDIDLPDTSDIKMLDYVLGKGQQVIVLSEHINTEFRQKILQKSIIDYVSKDGIEDIEYIIQTIKRVQKNQTHKVLLVDDSLVFRKQMSKLLKTLLYDVYSVAHGEEALGMLETHPDISLIITDYNMPVMNGLELIQEVRKSKSKNDLCIIAISGNSDDALNAQFLKYGANDYIKKPFSKEEFSCRVNNSIEALENIQTLTNYAKRDLLTGLYNRQTLLQEIDKIINNGDELVDTLAIGIIAIDSLEKISEAYGTKTRDRAIVQLSEIINSNKTYKDIAAHLSEEEFCLVLQNTNQALALEMFNKIKNTVEQSFIYTDDKKILNFTISIGVAMFDGDLDESMSQADMMLYNAKNSAPNQICI